MMQKSIKDVPFDLVDLGSVRFEEQGIGTNRQTRAVLLHGVLRTNPVLRSAWKDTRTAALADLLASMSGAKQIRGLFVGAPNGQ